MEGFFFLNAIKSFFLFFSEKINFIHNEGQDRQYCCRSEHGLWSITGFPFVNCASVLQIDKSA